MLVLLRVGCAVLVLLSPAALAKAAPAAQAQSPAPAPAEKTTADERLKKAAAAMATGPEGVDQAIKDLRDLLGSDPTLAEAHLLLGLAYGQMGTAQMLAEAKAELQQAIDLKPELIPARFYLADLYMRQGRTSQARDELQAALKIVPEQPGLLAMLGEAERQLGHPERALELQEQALAKQPGLGQAKYYRALALLDLKKPADAQTDLEQLASINAPDPDVYAALGRLYLDAGRNAEAVKTLRTGVTLGPNREEIHLLLARALRVTGALAEADRELTLASSGQATASAGYERMQVELAVEQGLLRRAQRRYTDSIASLRRAAGIRPDDGQVQRELARSYLAARMPAQASQAAARAEALGAPLTAAEKKQLAARSGAKE